MATDRKALKLLFKTYWGPKGWLDHRDRMISPEDLAYAKRLGVMFDPIALDHDAIVEWGIRVRDTVTTQDVTEAFLASLSSRHLPWRSALGSFAILTNLTPHHPRGRFSCDVCGMSLLNKPDAPHDLSLLNFYRHKWGGIWAFESILYSAFDLEQFIRDKPGAATAEDLRLFAGLLRIVANAGADDRPSRVEPRLSEVLRSSKSERRKILEILGYCGVLKAGAHPSFWETFVPYAARPERSGSPRNDWPYPIDWWQGRDGVNARALRYWFPDFSASIAAT